MTELTEERGFALDFGRRPLRSPLYPRFLGKPLLSVASSVVARWDRALARLEMEQEQVLEKIVRHSAKTEFGKRHGFAGIRGYGDFARSVPIGDYDSFSPYIDRMRQGESNLIVPEFVRYFGNSSGSSSFGKQKFLPISERQISEQRRAGADTLMRYLAFSRDADFLGGFTLGLFPPTTMRAEGPVLITSNPALMVTRIPAISRPLYLPHDDIRQMSHYETKLTTIAERYLDWDVRAVAGTTCWFTLLFEKVLAAARRRGRRADSVSDVWPSLKLLLGGGVSAEPYLPIIQKLLGRDDVTLVDSYNATEGGIYAASDHAGKPGMLMLPHRGTFFEFVPLEARGQANPARIPVWGVEAGRLYSIVVTTLSGLYAYELGDIVRFTETSPPRIEFAGRLAGCLSVTQELTTHVEVERAVAFATAQCNCRVREFGAAADVGAGGGAKSRYLLYVEFEPGAEPASLAAFETAVDAGLCQENRVYREHRTGDVAILPLRVVPLVINGSSQFLAEITRGNVQGKFPRIINEAQRAKLVAYVQASASSQ